MEHFSDNLSTGYLFSWRNITQHGSVMSCYYGTCSRYGEEDLRSQVDFSCGKSKNNVVERHC